MNLDYTTFYSEIENFYKLPEVIDTFQMGDRFQETWKKVFGCQEAKDALNVVYIWRTDKDIPRLKDLSNIVYIGKTKTSLYERHYRYSEVEATEEGNKLKYSHIIKEYGPIRITYMPFEKYGETLEKAEGRLLWWYFLNHLEYPPVNYSGTPYHNDVLS